MKHFNFKKNTFTFNTILPEISIVVPVYNQEDIIYRNLKSISQAISAQSELIILDDGSTDRTNEEIQKFINENNNQKITRIQLYAFNREKYETFCDDFAIRNAVGEYILEIQADMRITEANFDQKLLQAYKEFPDLFMISGRGTHNLLPMFNWMQDLTLKRYIQFIAGDLFRKYKPKIEIDMPSVPASENFFPISGESGRLGTSITSNFSKTTLNEKKIYLGQTVMRGPLFFSKEKYMNLGGFNVKAFFLGFDDHDLVLRAVIQKSWRSGHLPIGFESPILEGSMRQQNWKKRLTIFKKRLTLYKNFKNSFLVKNINGVNPPLIELQLS
jgi:glycosyltransferase involved in cell wall biosynthesis